MGFQPFKHSYIVKIIFTVTPKCTGISKTFLKAFLKDNLLFNNTFNNIHSFPYQFRVGL